MINIRKLAAVDMVWLGTRVILTEYALGIIPPLFLDYSQSTLVSFVLFTLVVRR